ncbi:hypothetical protein [Enterococcus sp. 5B3_DIV0040]|uniref:hypothetical protein n=1 Tax=Enterococcus sp. 5B3_DIV0040 TaxID=1834182 RepID=UPI000A358828|nr:hypothetical protein [Enterococcus sp. 5B3_DIV0040]OTO01221.1 hypothetical protein A5883_003538 [Enterococcus sp. 5B3_DIV0040]
MEKQSNILEKPMPRVKEQGIFRMTDIQRLGAECQCFPTLETFHLPGGKTRIVRRMRTFRIDGRNVVEFAEYHEGTERKRYEKQILPLKAIYPEIKRVTDASGKTIARRLKPDQPLRWVLPTTGHHSES